MKSRLDTPTKQCNYYSEWEVYYSETLSKLNSENVLSSVELTQNTSKINPKYMQRDLAKKSQTENTQIYTDTKMKTLKTSRFFYAPSLFWILVTTKIITWNKYILWCLYIYTILLNLQEWGSDTQVKTVTHIQPNYYQP